MRAVFFLFVVCMSILVVACDRGPQFKYTKCGFDSREKAKNGARVYAEYRCSNGVGKNLLETFKHDEVYCVQVHFYCK